MAAENCSAVVKLHKDSFFKSNLFTLISKLHERDWKNRFQRQS